MMVSMIRVVGHDGMIGMIDMIKPVRHRKLYA